MVKTNSLLYNYKDKKLLTKTTAAQNEVALSYQRVRGLYFLAFVFAAIIVHIEYYKEIYILILNYNNLEMYTLSDFT